MVSGGADTTVVVRSDVPKTIFAPCTYPVPVTSSFVAPAPDQQGFLVAAGGGEFGLGARQGGFVLAGQLLRDREYLAQEAGPRHERPVGTPQAIGAVHTLRQIPEACTRLEGVFTGEPGQPYRMRAVPSAPNCQPRARYVAAAQAAPTQAGGWILDDLVRVWPEIADWSPMAREQIEIEAAYAGYLDRQRADAESLRKDEDLRLPADLDYRDIGSLSNEVREKLIRVKPLTLGQAARIEGVTPGALTALLAHVRRGRAA